MTNKSTKTFDLATFTFNGKKLRTVVIDGTIWFVLKDMADALDLDRRFTCNSRRFLDDAEVLIATRRAVKTRPQVAVLFPAGSQASSHTLVSESGLYKCSLRAQRSNPAARDFQDWVTKEVLPRIRKHGGYVKDEEKVATGEDIFQPHMGTAWPAPVHSGQSRKARPVPTWGQPSQAP